MPDTEKEINSSKSKKENPLYLILTPVLLVVFGFLLRLLAVSQQESVGVDSVRYLEFAQNYMSKILFTYGPTGLKEVPDIGLPLLISIWVKFTGAEFEVVARWISVLTGTFTLILIYFLALRAAGRKSAVYALLLGVACQPLITYSALIQTESLFIFLVAGSCYLSYVATRRGYNTFWFMLGGMSVAYAYLTRGIGITFLIIFPLGVWLVSRYDGAFSILQVQRKYFIGLILFLIGFVIIALPYQVMLSKVYDSFLLSDQSKWHSPRVLHPEKDYSPDPRYDGILNEDKSDYLINDPEFFKSDNFSIITWTKAFVTKYLKNQVGIYYYHLRELFSPLMLILAGLGLFCCQWDKRFKTLMLLFGIWAIPFLILQPIYYTEARYISPLLIFTLVFAGKGVVVLTDWFIQLLPKCSPLRVQQVLTIVLFLLLTPMMIYPVTHRGPQYSYPELREAGNFLGGYFGASESRGVMAVLPVTGYYAQAEPNLVLPRGEIDTVIKFATSRDIKYIVLEERKVHKHRPELRDLLYSSAELGNKAGRLKLIYDNDDISGYKVRIFEIVD